MNALCPICHASCQILRKLTFPAKLSLPQRVCIAICRTCDFAFSSPRDAASYSAFYRANMNDTLGADLKLTAAEKCRYRGQAAILQPRLVAAPAQRVLDVGCGQAGLLRALHRQYPEHAYFAADPNVSAPQMADQDIHFTTDWNSLEGSFDLIILSHVIERVVDFDDIARLSKRLTESGCIYVEVPDASRYGNFLRREFLYYFDRLHINHFTRQALCQLVSRWGLHVSAAGRSEFEYKDGQPYPALYVMAERRASHSHAIPLEAPLQRILQNYVTCELDRARGVRQKLENRLPIVVYGFGDNFFKSSANGGPLEGIPIAAIIDLRHASLSQSQYANAYRFLDIDTCCAEFPELTYVVSVSWGNSEVRQALQDHGIQNIELI